MPIFPGRYTATIDGEFVVFLIGMRINRPWKPHTWLPVFAAMRPMIRELEADPASGFLGATHGLLAAGPALVQYWRSFEHLERYARRQDAHHLPAWRRFNQRVRASGDVGIWHETYKYAPVTTKPATQTCPASAWPPPADTHPSAAPTAPPPNDSASGPKTHHQSPATELPSRLLYQSGVATSERVAIRLCGIGAVGRV